MLIIYRIITLILFFLVYIIGLIGNGLLIFIVFRQKNLRTVPNILVVSLAFGDFLFVFFCVPFGAVAYSFEYYPFSKYYCRFENFIINLSLGVSIFSLIALSADRYKIIAKPFSTHANDPTIKIKLIVIFIWLLSICFALPETIYSGLITHTTNISNNKTIELIYCWSPNEFLLLNNHKFMIIRQILRLIIYYIMPFIFITIFYSLIAKTLIQTKSFIYSSKSSSCSSKNNSITEENSSINMKLNNNNNNNIRHNRESLYSNQITNLLNNDIRTKKQIRARHKVAKTVLFLCLVFFICWLPKQLHDLYWFIGVIVYSSKWNYFWQINKILAFILTYIYSCINPFALYFLSSTFRHFYKRYLCFCSKRHLNQHQQRRFTRDLSTNSHYQRYSSVNETNITIYYDLNRIKMLKDSKQRSI